MTPGDILSLTIEKPAAGGPMIARVDGLVVLVSGAIPGERVRVAIERVGKGVAHARTIDVEEASADRRRPSGDPLCGGCLYAYINYPRQLELKSLVIADAFSRLGRLELPAPVSVAPSPEEGYRMRARFHQRGRVAGFFREGTHEVCDPRQTRQMLPATVDVLDRLVAATQSLGWGGSVGVREIEVAENLDASHRVAHLEFAPGAPPLDPRSIDRVAAMDGLTGLSSPGGGRGDVHVTDTIAIDGYQPIRLRRHVLAFFQGNRYLLNQLVSHVVMQVPPGVDVVDCYAGVGLFAVAAASVRGSRVIAVEGDRLAAADLATNAAASSSTGSVIAAHQAVEQFVSHDRPGAVIVDPPRSGMSREALNRIVQLRAERLIYVSCDVATLARDARRLADSGYRVTRADAFDMFPNTPHVETVVVFDGA